MTPTPETNAAREIADDRYDNKTNPRIRGQCPSCGWHTLFLGSQGYVTCSLIGCKDPGAANDLLNSPSRHRSTRIAELEEALKDQQMFMLKVHQWVARQHVSGVKFVRDEACADCGGSIPTGYVCVRHQLARLAISASAEGEKPKEILREGQNALTESIVVSPQTGVTAGETAPFSPAPSTAEQVKELRERLHKAKDWMVEVAEFTHAMTLRDAIATIERLENDGDMADGCLAMIFDMLKALDQTGYDGSATPPMMYNDWLLAIVGRDRAALSTVTRDRDAARKVIERIAEYGKDGLCPYGCDCPGIARDFLAAQETKR